MQQSIFGHFTALVLLSTACLATAPALAATDFDPAASAPGNLRFAWISGSISAKANQDVRIQVHRYNEHTYILRQNPAIHWEAPFMYLLFGNERAVLLDTGATAEPEFFPLRDVVDALIARWQRANDIDGIELLVLPTGSDFSQVQAMAQFNDRPATTVVAPNPRARQKLLELGSKPEDDATLDLGGRVLNVLRTPGLNAHAITLYDAWSDLLFTGNALYAGRLVIRDFEAYRSSLKKLMNLGQAHPVRWIFGGRIEMTAQPGMDYRLRANYRPLEHELQLSSTALRDSYQIVQLINGREDIRIHDDFIVMHGVGRGARDYGWPVYIPEQFREVRVR